MPGMRGIDVAGEPTGDLVVHRRLGGAEDEPAGERVPQADPMLRMRILERVPDLETLSLRIDIGEIEAVAVTHPGAPHRPAVVIDGDRAVQDLVEAVAVDVARLDAVLSLALVLERGPFVGPAPQLLELAILQGPGVDAHHAVGSAHDDEARCLAVEIRDAEHVAAGAVPRIVGPLGGLAAFDPVGLVDLLAGRAVVDRDVLGPVEDEALAAVERLLARRGVGRRSAG